MSCTAMRKKIKAYLDGELPAAEAAAVKSHLVQCPACSREAEELAKTWELLLALPDVQEAPDLIPATMARILAEGENTRSRKLLRWLFPVPLSAATAALVIGLVIGIGLGRIIASTYLDRGETDTALYLEVFQDTPPQSIGDAYIKVNYAMEEKGI
jgi:anti-sigma factor RsiW